MLDRQRTSPGAQRNTPHQFGDTVLAGDVARASALTSAGRQVVETVDSGCLVDSHTVVDDADDKLLGGPDGDVDGIGMCMPQSVAQALAHNGFGVRGKSRRDGTVDGSLESDAGSDRRVAGQTVDGIE